MYKYVARVRITRTTYAHEIIEHFARKQASAANSDRAWRPAQRPDHCPLPSPIAVPARA